MIWTFFAHTPWFTRTYFLDPYSTTIDWLSQAFPRSVGRSAATRIRALEWPAGCRSFAEAVLLLHSVLEVSTKTGYHDAMSPLTAWIRVLPLTAGILSGCTTLVTTYDRIRARLTEPEVDQTIHRGGAWFLTPSKGYIEGQGTSSGPVPWYHDRSKISSL